MNAPVTTATGCPSWCRGDHDPVMEGRDDYCHHLGGDTVVHLTDAEVEGGGETVRVELTRYDDGGELGRVGILISRRGLNASGKPGWWDVLGTVINLPSTERLGYALLNAVRIGLVASWPVCLDCDRAFEPDSSPHLDRCWTCAEIVDAEAEARGGPDEPPLVR